MAKKVFPMHLDEYERRILEVISARDNVSLAEAARRCIRVHESVLTPHEQHHLGSSENAA